MGWFPPPEPIRAAITTRLPDAFRAPQRNEWADANKSGAAVDSFLEGPCFDASGTLHVCDIPNGRIFRVGRDGTWSVLTTYDGWPNGLAFAADGRLLIADYRRGLMICDPADGAVRPLVPHMRSESFKGLNDLVVAGDGAIYVTDQGQTGMQDPTGRVYRRAADGRLERLLDTCPSPNGIALAPDGRHLFVALTRACQIWRLPVTADGVTGKVNVFCHTPGGVSGPDGLAVTADGGLVVANPGHACAWVLDAHGVPRFRIESPVGRTVTNAAFDPNDPYSLVMTESDTGSILEARLPLKGHLPVPFATTLA